MTSSVRVIFVLGEGVMGDTGGGDFSAKSNARGFGGGGRELASIGLPPSSN